MSMPALSGFLYKIKQVHLPDHRSQTVPFHHGSIHGSDGTEWG